MSSFELNHYTGGLLLMLLGMSCASPNTVARDASKLDFATIAQGTQRARRYRSTSGSSRACSRWIRAR
jgi:hypothetical protein